MSPRVRGARMRAIADEPAFLDRLPGCGWIDGGCAIYAEAAATYFGATATIAYVVAYGIDTYPLVDHAVAIVGEFVIDGDGATPLAGYLAAYSAREGREDAELELLHRADLLEDRALRRSLEELFVDPSLSAELAAVWRARLGEPT